MERYFKDRLRELYKRCVHRDDIHYPCGHACEFCAYSNFWETLDDVTKHNLIKFYKENPEYRFEPNYSNCTGTLYSQVSAMKERIDLHYEEVMKKKKSITHIKQC